MAVNNTYYDYDYIIPIDDQPLGPPAMQPAQIVSLVCYSLVLLLGVPGNALVVWVTGFCMPHSVTSLWFLNLALADLLCCLSLPLLMVPLAQDDHWSFGPLACTLIKGLLYLVMYCSVLQLVVISVDRCLLVTKPVWCQNKRRPRAATAVCVLIWGLALVGSIPQFIFYEERHAAQTKKECVMHFPSANSARLVYSSRTLFGFVLPFLIIAGCHWKVYKRAEAGISHSVKKNGSRRPSKRTLRIILAVIITFFCCWLPLHVMDFVFLGTPRHADHRPRVLFGHTLATCLAYVNSSLNPLLYVCLGRGFKDRVNRSLRGILQFATEEPQSRVSVANNESHSTSLKEITKI